MSLLDLLTAQNVAEFNAKRGNRVTLDLFAADLASLLLPGIDLSGANLEKADFSGTDLTGANLSKATLGGADFTGAILINVVAIKAKLREAYLGGADLSSAQLSGADLGEADLGGANLSRAKLNGAKLREAMLRGAGLDHADLTEAKLNSADLREAELVGSILTEADLTSANLDGASLEDATLNRARLGGASLRGARLIGANLSGADLTGADLTGAVVDEDTEFTGADLTDAVLDPALAERLRGAKAAATPTSELPSLHLDEPSVASAHGFVAALWLNAEGEETEVVRVAVRAIGDQADGTAGALAVPAEQVVARTILPSPTGFWAVVLIEKPGGMDVAVADVATDGTVGELKSTRLGYSPTVLPVFQIDGDGFLIYGIGRGMLSVHRWSIEGVAEKLRSPASTYRGFCDRLNPVLLGKGGTVASVESDGIGRLLIAPSGFPGRIQASSARKENLVAVAWVNRDEKGVRIQRLGHDAEPLRLEATSDISTVDLKAVEGGWWLAYTREPPAERDVALPIAVFVPDAGDLGKPLTLLGPDEVEDIEDLRFIVGEGAPRLGGVTVDETLLVIELGAKGGRVVARVS